MALVRNVLLGIIYFGSFLFYCVEHIVNFEANRMSDLGALVTIVGTMLIVGTIAFIDSPRAITLIFYAFLNICLSQAPNIIAKTSWFQDPEIRSVAGFELGKKFDLSKVNPELAFKSQRRNVYEFYNDEGLDVEVTVYTNPEKIIYKVIYSVTLRGDYRTYEDLKEVKDSIYKLHSGQSESEYRFGWFKDDLYDGERGISFREDYPSLVVFANDYTVRNTKNAHRTINLEEERRVAKERDEYRKKIKEEINKLVLL